MKTRLLLTAALALQPALSFGAAAVCTNDCHPFYFGVQNGYGSTTWDGLVPARNNQSIAMSMSTPIDVSEGGLTGGFFLGYELSPYFAIEGNYVRYQDAIVNFGTDSIFYFDNGYTSLRTSTQSTSLIGKIMLVIPHTEVRAYSSAGLAVSHRWDSMRNYFRATPTFGLGLNYNITNHAMIELAFSYTAGYGESEIAPVNDYMPFLYSALIKIAYRV
jgi:Outer membrane protein beta-barrel domain